MKHVMLANLKNCRNKMWIVHSFGVLHVFWEGLSMDFIVNDAILYKDMIPFLFFVVERFSKIAHSFDCSRAPSTLYFWQEIVGVNGWITTMIFFCFYRDALVVKCECYLRSDSIFEVVFFAKELPCKKYSYLMLGL